MSLNLTSIHTALVGLVNSIHPSEVVVIADQGAPRPTSSYTSIKINSTSASGLEASSWDNQVSPGIDLIETVTVQKRLFVSFNVYYGDAESRANRLHLLLASSASLELLKASGLGLGAKSPVRDITNFVGKVSEARAQFDVDFHVVDSEALVVRSISTVEIEGEIETSGDILDALITNE